MTFSKTLVVATAVTLLVGVPAAQAQHRGGGGGHNRGGNGGGSRVAPRDAGPRSGGGAPRAGRPGAYSSPRSYGSPRSYSSPRLGAIAPRSYPYQRYSYGSSRGYWDGRRGGVTFGRAVPRVFGSRGFRGSPVRFYRPYYSFRPRLSLGFGLWVGYPIIYPYSYGYYDPYYEPYGYLSPYPYGYSNPYPYAYSNPYPANAYAYPRAAYPPPSASVGIERDQDQAETGGVSFEITPASAEVFVDGSLMGTAGDFTPTSQPLALTAGRHRVEIRAPGYRTMIFDADIIAGQVVPYRGTLQR